MGQFWRWSVAALAMGCHAGERFDWSGVPLDAGPGSDERATEEPASPSIQDVSAVVRDAGARVQEGPPAPNDVELIHPAASLLSLPGAICTLDVECASAHCANGRCCNRACSDCEACSTEGRCEPLSECGFASCDAGICEASRGPLGATCTQGHQCQSGYCTDGVCCESACDGVCQLCGADGACNLFPASDQGCGETSCPEDTACRTHEIPMPRACAAWGRCAGPEDCLVRTAPPGTTCDAVGSLCDEQGECAPAPEVPALQATQVCPQPGGSPQDVRVELDGVAQGCWTGASYDVGVAYSFGSITTGPAGAGSITLGAYLVATGAASAKTQAFDAAGVLLRGCVVVDPWADGQWYYVTFNGETCRNAAFVRVTAHMNDNGDL